MLELQVVDAFTKDPFSGNPAAVTVLDRFPPDDWMAKVAREINLSETAFAVRRPDGDFDLRWFTPAAEVDLCGHATLASAHVLGGTARFHTRGGVLTCRPGPDGTIEMDFPADPVRPADLDLDLPGATVRFTGQGQFDFLLEVADAAWLRSFRPDIGAIAAASPARGLIVTAAGDAEGIDFVSRFFAPNVGIDEDPVTGSAHCTLAGYWADRTGRAALTGYQASARGGTVRVRIEGDRVVIAGWAVTVSDI
ncbi:MAG TPA: PhzF family phenazine biosynthesis isomerase, partial [Acidimicrobiales bacterium]|nr:PhzF family phenazine biosynthesis isomerase [Acidimicrobiales bacterium]